MGLRHGDRFDTDAFGATTRWRVRQVKTLGGETRTVLIRVERNPIPDGSLCIGVDMSFQPCYTPGSLGLGERLDGNHLVATGRLVSNRLGGNLHTFMG